MILVVGATGLLGGEIARRLRANGQRVRAFVRQASDRSRVRSLEDLGAELVIGDLTDAASLPPACAGTDTVISTATGVFPREAGDSIDSVDRDGHLALVDAAARAGVDHFVYVSVSGNVPTGDPLTAAKRTLERHLRESRMAETILRCGPFMETWLGAPVGFDLASGSATVFGSGEAPVSWIARGDVAEFAVRCVAIPAARNTTIELGGPQALSQLDVVRIAEDIGGRPIDVERLSVETLQRQVEDARTPTDQLFAAAMLHLTDGDAVDMAATADRFSLQLTPVRDYVRRVLAGDPVIGSQ